ncbi:hypothetical protein HDE_04820 [Halotydeus destructor]|nr:hypothetical protein HDE_04820 [Halotydeus destructor]
MSAMLSENGDDNQVNNQDNQQGTHDLLSLYKRCLNGETLDLSSDGEVSEFEMSDFEETPAKVEASRSRRRTSQARRSSLPFQMICTDQDRRTTLHQVGKLLKNFYGDAEDTMHESQSVLMPYKMSDMTEEQVMDAILKEYNEYEELNQSYPSKMAEYARKEMDDLISMLQAEVDMIKTPVTVEEKNHCDVELNDLFSNLRATINAVKLKMKSVNDKLKSVDLLNSIK